MSRPVTLARPDVTPLARLGSRRREIRDCAFVPSGDLSAFLHFRLVLRGRSLKIAALSRRERETRINAPRIYLRGLAKNDAKACGTLFSLACNATEARRLRFGRCDRSHAGLFSRRSRESHVHQSNVDRRARAESNSCAVIISERLNNCERQTAGNNFTHAA